MESTGFLWGSAVYRNMRAFFNLPRRIERFEGVKRVFFSMNGDVGILNQELQKQKFLEECEGPNKYIQ